MNPLWILVALSVLDDEREAAMRKQDVKVDENGCTGCLAMMGYMACLGALLLVGAVGMTGCLVVSL